MMVLLLANCVSMKKLLSKCFILVIAFRSKLPISNVKFFRLCVETGFKTGFKICHHGNRLEARFQTLKLLLPTCSTDILLRITITL